VADKAELKIDGKAYELPVVHGTEGDSGIDVSELRSKTSYITYDPAFGNTGSCQSAICYIDGEKGILRYRGIPVEQLAENSRFIETAYLLLFGQLPTEAELNWFSAGLTENAALHDDVRHFFYGFPSTTHPMVILSSVVCALSGFHPTPKDPAEDDEVYKQTAIKLMAKVRTIAAYSYKRSIGQPFIYPRRDLKYCANFLHMMFSLPYEDFNIDVDAERALNILFILHADHEQNCSTSTVRLVGSARANIYASIAAGISALSGPIHGGANQDVMEMLEEIHQAGGNIDSYLSEAMIPNSSKRLSGFGHRIYKTYDPRAKIIKEYCHKILRKHKGTDPLLEIAMKLEERALREEYFIKRNLYPNVDFYSGIVLKAIGIPTNMFPVMFAIGRLPGWITHWKEMRESKPAKIGRPRQIYVGPERTDYVPIDIRK